jgi:hypothetical protein
LGRHHPRIAIKQPSSSTGTRLTQTIIIPDNDDATRRDYDFSNTIVTYYNIVLAAL